MLQILIAGLTVGFVYALVAMSFAPSYASSKVVNFGQGEIVMVGTVLGAVLVGQQGLPYFAALPVIVVVTAVIDGLMYLVVIKTLRSRGAPLINMVIGTLTAGMVVAVAVAFLFGLDPRSFPSPFGSRPIQVLGAFVGTQVLVVLVGVAVVLLVVWLLYERSRVGLAVRATSEQRDTSRLVGINVETLTLGTFLVSGALAGLAGFLYGPLANADPTSGFQFALWGFTALIVGGLGSWIGPVVAGVALGVLDKVMDYWFGDGYSTTVVLAILLLFLYVRPQGLMGRVESQGAAA
ncbi:MAG: branched-chain amino acid ABC transporter permease [Actinomycetota bacterium]|nr:branched-chain amino acid ABC transporter permease [Actinomycetota bacterium]